ncbi:MAG: DUF1566 domain-containing protein [Myxococcaceae bacterium]
MNRILTVLKVNFQIAVFSSLATVISLPALAVSSVSNWANWGAATGVYEPLTNETQRYTAKNGAVTDSYTGLQWQSSGAGSYIWDPSSQDSVQAYCTAQNTGGYTDWRVPTRAELQTLVDYGSSGPAINSKVFPNTI